MWEATLLPDQWSLYANKADGLIVPSAGQVPIFRDSGYEGPIYTVVDGIEMDTFQYVERPERDTFTFFTWGRLSSRKCPWEILSCFSEAFDGVKDVRLVMKTRDHEFGAGRTVGIPEIRDSRITAVDADWSRKQLTDALFNADCAVFMSHGEGSMNPPVQAMATGLPVIGPNHSGCSVWANSKYCYPVGLDKHAPLVASPMGMRNGKVLEWWNMDRGEMIQTMRYVYEHQKEAKKKGKAAAAWVRRRHSVDNMLDELIGVLGGLD
jgi:glycosyltransferase involved in cell wall biosynthesis